jgi:hypothetical protein
MEGSLVAYKVFTNGSTLQASELNENLMQQSVAVFSNAAARTAAITTPLEGQLTYLEDTNLYQHWNGSAWVSPFGLTLIKAQTIGAGVSSVVFTNAFSADYENYKILISGGAASTTALLQLRLGAANTAYYQSIYLAGFTGAGSVSAVSNGAQFTRVGFGSVNLLHLDCDLRNPFLAEETILTASYVDSRTNGESGFIGGYLNNSISYTDFTVTPSSGTLTGGTIAVYGYRRN